MSQRFARGRTATAGALGAHNEAYQHARGLMASETLFDVSRDLCRRLVPGRPANRRLVARRLVEAGVPFVRVARAWWDSHGQNFETHQELVPELDHVMATLLDDLRARAACSTNTLVRHARRVWPHAFHQCQLGPRPFRLRLERRPSNSRIQGGLGLRQDRPDKGQTRSPMVRSALPRTLRHHLQRLSGIDHQKNYYVGSRPVPLTEPDTEPIEDVLA